MCVCVGVGGGAHTSVYTFAACGGWGGGCAHICVREREGLMVTADVNLERWKEKNWAMLVRVCAWECVHACICEREGQTMTADVNLESWREKKWAMLVCMCVCVCVCTRTHAFVRERGTDSDNRVKQSDTQWERSMLLSSTNRSCEDVPNFLLFIPLPGSVWELYLKHLVVVEDFPRLSEHCLDVGLGIGDHIQDRLLILLQVMKEKGTGSYQPKLLLQVTKWNMTGVLQYKLLLEREVMWNNTNITLSLPEWFYTLMGCKLLQCCNNLGGGG